MTGKEARRILNYIFKKAGCKFSQYVGGTLFVNRFNISTFNEKEPCELNMAVGSYEYYYDFHAMNAGTDPKDKDKNIVNEMFLRLSVGETIAACKHTTCVLLFPFTTYEQIAVEAELDTSLNAPDSPTSIHRCNICHNI